MTILVQSPRGDIEFGYKKFPGGEVHPYIGSLRHHGDIERCTITAHLRNTEDIMSLFLVTDAMRREFGDKLPIKLIMPYVPYGRQDRVCARGDAFGAHVFCSMINAQRYETVTIWDAHSDVVSALLDRCINVHCWELTPEFAVSDWIMVAPDASAAKEKVPRCAKESGCPMITGLKHRNVVTGEITGASIVEDDVWRAARHMKGQAYLMVDDICDGGATFVALAKLIRAATEGSFIYLYVTHGIFSKGLEPFAGLINEVMTPNPWPNIVGSDAVVFTHLK